MFALLPTKLCIIILLYANLFHSAYTDDYCTNTLDLQSRSHKLRFLGDIGEVDYGVVNTFKSLHCCAKEFTTIEWLRDNQPYPWSRNTSTFVIDEGNNQTLISNKVQMHDTGVYTCIVKDDVATIQRDIKLEVLDLVEGQYPRMTYATKDKIGRFGDLLALYCEGFVGIGSITANGSPSFSGTITWEKGLSERLLDRKFIDGERVVQVNSYRDENQILGSHLLVKSLDKIDLNMYTCRISNGAYRAVEQRAWLIHVNGINPEAFVKMVYIVLFAMIPVFLLVCVIMVWASMSMPLEQFSQYLRFKFGWPKINCCDLENSKYILVVYHRNDEFLMSSTIIPMFEDWYPVRVTSYTVQDYEEDFKNLQKTAKGYDSVMVIMTPSLTGNEWSCERIDLSIRIIRQIHKAFICIFSRKLPPLVGKSGRKLKKTLNKSQKHILQQKSISAEIIKTYIKKLNKFNTTLPIPCGSAK